MKVLIIGLGSIAKKHIPALNRNGVKDIFALRSSRSSGTYEGVKNLYSFEEIEEHEFDFFLISNVTSHHAPTIKELIKFKKPLFIEKPLFGEVNKENAEIVAEVEKLEIPTYIGCSLRFLDSLREIKKLIKAARINEVNIYSGSYLPDWRPNVDFRQSYSARKDLGGGVHMDLIHELDYLYWIFGAPEKTSSLFSSRSSLEIEAIDYANYLWSYSEFTASVTLNYYRHDAKRTLEIITDEGTYLVDLIQNRIFKDNEQIFSSNQVLRDTLNDQMEFFLKEVLEENKSGFNNIQEAYKILQLCLNH